MIKNVEKIYNLVNEHFKCTEIKRINIHSNDFLEFTRMLYQTDKRCFRPYLVEKVKYIKYNYDLQNENKFNHYPIHTFRYETNDPNYDEENISQQAVTIKEQIRKMFVNEVKEYIRDIIIHITDNPEDTLNAEKHLKYMITSFYQKII